MPLANIMINITTETSILSPIFCVSLPSNVWNFVKSNRFYWISFYVNVQDDCLKLSFKSHYKSNICTIDKFLVSCNINSWLLLPFGLILELQLFIILCTTVQHNGHVELYKKIIGWCCMTLNNVIKMNEIM